MTFADRLRPLILAAAVVAAFPATAQLPTLGASGDMTTAAERKLGEKIARELYRDPDYIDDPVLVEYVRKVWQPLLDAARARGELSSEMDERFAWQVLMGKDRTINAFALPGGWLGLNLGLISATQNRDELAGVLAQELSHVTQRHISRLMEQEKKQTPLVIGAMILGAIAASKSPDAANAAIVGGQALAAQSQLNFSRDMEREADRIGYGVATQAGYDPHAFATVFEKLQQAARHNDAGAFPYLRTHPLTTERIAEMQSRQQLAGGPVRPEGGLAPEHAMIAARARVLSNPGVDALRAYVREPRELPSGASAARQAGAWYASALASARLRDFSQAAADAERLRGQATEPAAARLAKLLAAEIALAAGEPQRALSLLDADPKERPELMLAAQARLLAGRPGDIAQRLQSWVALQPRDAMAWQWLARANAMQGQNLRAIRAEAEAQVAQMDYAAAMDRFKAGQDLARRGGGDHIEASIIDTRARQVESLLREQALER